jgi:2-dehydropantoate 2-reductase
MNIAVVGVGGVGGYFGGKLCRLIPAQKANIYFVARGPHLDKIRREGLRIRTVAEGEWTCHPTLATDRIQDLPALDLCLLCIKSYDLAEAAQQLSEKASEATILIPLLNGVDIYERIHSRINAAQIFPGCVYIGAHIESPGNILQRGGSCKIIFGNIAGAAAAIPDSLFDIFQHSGIDYEWMEDISPALWTKFLFIAGISMAGAAYGKTLGQLMESRPLSAHIQAVMREISAIAEKKGIALSAHVVEDSYAHLSRFTYETKTSFQRDYETTGKPDERDILGGAILRLGEELGVETPAARDLMEFLQRRKPWPILNRDDQ